MFQAVQASLSQKVTFEHGLERDKGSRPVSILGSLFLPDEKLLQSPAVEQERLCLKTNERIWVAMAE